MKKKQSKDIDLEREILFNNAVDALKKITNHSDMLNIAYIAVMNEYQSTTNKGYKIHLDYAESAINMARHKLIGKK